MTRDEITSLVAKLQVESLLLPNRQRELMQKAAVALTELLIEKITREELEKRKLS